MAKPGTSVPKRTKGFAPTGNLLLDKLGAVNSGIDQDLKPVQVSMEQELMVPGQHPREVFFPITCVCSILLELKSGQRAEVGTVGREGFVGIPVVIRMPARERAIVQVPGQAYVLAARLFLKAIEADRRLNDIVVQYIGYAYQVAQQVNACNAYHTVDQRLARWLLVCADRARRTEFEMNHELLSHMVAATRPRVTEAARRLRDAGIIDYGRATRMRIVDRPRLERQACECYTASNRAG